MTDLNQLFRQRIGIPANEELTFDNLDYVLEKTATAIPFENLCVMENRTTDITRENIINKIIDRNEGGLCYELNYLLSLFLAENGFHAELVRGVVYDHFGQQWSTTGKSHVVNILSHNGQFYIVDTGFGGNLPLKPVPLNGETVTSNNGEFRVERAESEYGDYILYMKLKHKDQDWRIGYAFDSKDVIKNAADLNKVQKIILEHPDSSFNKSPLMVKLTEKGSRTLTGNTFTEWADGKMEKEEIDAKRVEALAKEHFGLVFGGVE